jgi:hypothetical protein
LLRFDKLAFKALAYLFLLMAGETLKNKKNEGQCSSQTEE